MKKYDFLNNNNKIQVGLINNLDINSHFYLKTNMSEILETVFLNLYQVHEQLKTILRFLCETG